MSPPTITETRPSGHQVGERAELARYTISAGERVIYGQRVTASCASPIVPRPAQAGHTSSSASRTATPL